MKRLALLGASGHGKVVADAAMAAGWDEVVFYDDAWPEKSANAYWPVAGGTQALLRDLHAFDGVLVTIGQCTARWQKHRALKEAGARLTSLVHPGAWVSPRARIGAGTVVMAGAVVSVDAVLGEACIVNCGASVDHDCRLDAAVHIAPGAHVSGSVAIGTCSWVGVGAAVRQGVRIGANAIVGAGAVVVGDVPDESTVAGNPARALAPQGV